MRKQNITDYLVKKMETESIKQKKIFILSVITELADIFPMRLTDVSKIAWVEELIIYDEDRILKTKTLLRSGHRGNLYPSHFHEAITNFKKPIELKPDPPAKNPIPMPDSFKKKYLRMREEWEK